MNKRNIFNFGIKEDMQDFEIRSIVLSNQISLLLSLIFIGLAIITFKMGAITATIVLSSVFVVMLLIPFINKIGGTNITAFFISVIVPIAIVGTSILSKLNIEGSIDLTLYFAPRLLLIGTLVLPLILIDYRKTFLFSVSLIFHFVAIVGYSEIQKFFGVGIERAVYNPDTYMITYVISGLSMLVLFLSFIFFQKINNKNSEEIKQRTLQLNEERIELTMLQEETEKLNQELIKQRIDVEMSKQRVEQTNKELAEFAKQQEELTKELFAKTLETEQNKNELQNFANAQEKMSQEIFAKSLEAEQKNFEIERAYKNLELLSSMGKKIISSLTTDDILRSAYKNISELMNVTFFAVGIYNKEKQRIDFTGTIKDNLTLPSYFYELSKKNSFSVWCLKNKDEIFINDLDSEYTKYFEEYPDLRHFKAKSFIYCPLISKDEAIGTVAIHHKDTNAFSENKLFIMRTLATYISLAIQNAESYNKIEEQMIEINDKNIMVESSLNYAKTIQGSMLPSEQILKTEYNTELVFFPKDIVSGDFYWTANIFNKRKFVVAVDCTGHGVPGAFLSFVGSKSLDEIVHNKQIFSPKKILDALDQNIIEILNQEHSHNRDGMDVSMCAIEEQKDGKIMVLFSGAKSPLFYYSKKEKKVNYIKGSRKAIGGGYYDEQEFEEHKLILEKGDILYIASDGYIDQNSSAHKRFGRDRFIGMIEQIAEYPISKQRTFMKQIFNKFKGDDPQRDDVTVLITEL